jgi:hypothetical protein
MLSLKSELVVVEEFHAGQKVARFPAAKKVWLPMLSLSPELQCAELLSDR